MMNQYPAAFEFTEAYLTVLSDSMWIPLFSTFLFSSPKQRAQQLMVRDIETHIDTVCVLLCTYLFSFNGNITVS